MTDSIRVFELKGLSDDFNDDLAKSILEIHIDKALHPQEAVEKSLYNFDLETPEGVDRLLELLPILDPEIINEVYQEIFPGYPVDTLAPRMARIELRGYLMDYLQINGRPGTEATGTEATGSPEGSPEEKESSGGKAGQGPSGFEGPAPGGAQGAGTEGLSTGIGSDTTPDKAEATEAGSETR